MKEITELVVSDLFTEIPDSDFSAMMRCIGYRIHSFRKGEIIALEGQYINHIGIVISGTVDVDKEDIWGNRTMLIRMCAGELFGESFACGSESESIVTFRASSKAEILFMPFQRIMTTCPNACKFHHQLITNMVRIIANKNRELMLKVEVVSKKTIREKILAYLSIQSRIFQSNEFDIPLSRTAMAEYLCVDRSAMTRELVNMKKEGSVCFTRNHFKITCKEALL